MNVTLSQLQPCTAGAVEIRNEPNGLFFDRMPTPQRAHYASTEAFITRARCQTGIRIRFRSCTRHLAITLKIGRMARVFPCVDLVVDHVFRGTFTADQTQPGKMMLFQAESATSRSFEIWLPYAVESWLAALEIDDGSDFEPLPPEPVNWLVIGDSISQGMTCLSPSRTYPALAARTLGWNHHNVAVGGARMETAAGSLRDIPADVAIVAFGCNDWNGCKKTDCYEADTRGLLDALLRDHPGLPVGLITPYPAVWEKGEKNDDGVWLETFRDILRKGAGDYPTVRIIEGPTLIPAETGAFVDGIHPNDAGMAVLARNLAPVLAGLVK